MKRNSAISLTLFVVQILVFASCTKNQPPQTLFSNLVGNWRKTAFATDDNGCGCITPAEISPQIPGTVEILVLRADSTGYDSTSVDKISQSTLLLNWYVFGDSLVIQYHAHLTDTYYVDNVNSKNLTLYINRTGTGLAAYYYSR